MEKDYSLLRPFDLEAAKRGEKICWSHIDEPVTYIGSDSKGRVAFESGGGCDFNPSSQFRMSPLAWVEGRPVYRGDVLYWNTQSSDAGSKFTATGVLEDPNYIAGVSLLSDGDRLGEDGLSGMRPENLTWKKPKTKREGWVNVYRDSTEAYIHPNKKEADESSDEYRVACIRIEWEE